MSNKNKKNATSKKAPAKKAVVKKATPKKKNTVSKTVKPKKSEKVEEKKTPVAPPRPERPETREQNNCQNSERKMDVLGDIMENISGTMKEVREKKAQNDFVEGLHELVDKMCNRGVPSMIKAVEILGDVRKSLIDSIYKGIIDEKTELENHKAKLDLVKG